MANLLRDMNWVEKSAIVDELLQRENLIIHPMKQGFEAEVMKISSDQESYVLKLWNRGSSADVRMQYHMLRTLSERGLPVSMPLGWGTHADGGYKVLLTLFDGTPVQKVKEPIMKELAHTLSSIHQIPAAEIEDVQLPVYKFVDYFFPGIKDHPDLSQAVNSLVRIAGLRQDCVIHGDYHLNNIVEDEGRYSVIDWTNVQLGDSRYDFAWSLILMKMYIGEKYATAFRKAYVSEHPLPEKEIELFEAIACMRVLLLNRRGGIPLDSGTINKVKRLISNNPYLSELELGDLASE